MQSKVVRRLAVSSIAWLGPFGSIADIWGVDISRTVAVELAQKLAPDATPTRENLVATNLRGRWRNAWAEAEFVKCALDIFERLEWIKADFAGTLVEVLEDAPKLVDGGEKSGDRGSVVLLRWSGEISVSNARLNNLNQVRPKGT